MADAWGTFAPALPSWVDQGTEQAAVEAAAAVAAERTRRSVLGQEVPDMFGSLAPRTRGRREEGAITRGLYGLGHIPIGILGAAGGLMQSNLDALGEQFPAQSGITATSTDYDPRRAAGSLAGETATNVIGLPGIMGGAPATLASGAIRRTPGLPMEREAVLAADQQPFGSMAPDGIRAYHGSPHDFDRFDLSKIGTGEGAQSYGHGLYFAGNERVAKEYRDANIPATAAPRRTLFGKELTPGTPEYHAGTLLETTGMSVPKVRKEVQGWIDNARPSENLEHYQRVLETLGRISGKRDFGMLKPQGKMYEVNINAAPDDFLQWDKSLSQQDRLRSTLESMPVDMFKRWQDSGAWPHVSGETAYREMAGGLTNKAHAEGRHVAASSALREAGVPGIKYLDQGSRGRSVEILAPQIAKYEERLRGGGLGQFEREDMQRALADLVAERKRVQKGTSNYVLFDDSLVNILRKYAMPGAAGTGAAWGSMAPGGEQ